MDINLKYQEIIEQLKQGHRYLKPLDKNDVQILNDALNSEIDSEQIKKIFCILDNTQTNAIELKDSIIKMLENSNINDEIKIYALEASRKHIIDSYFKRGKRLPGEYIMCLQKLLESKNPELQEWTLRTIDECGSQSIIFRETVKKIRPRFFKIYNKHYRAVLQLCEYLERRWSGNRPA